MIISELLYFLDVTNSNKEKNKQDSGVWDSWKIILTNMFSDQIVTGWLLSYREKRNINNLYDELKNILVDLANLNNDCKLK